MEYQFRASQKTGYLHVTVVGDNTPETVMRYLKDIYESCVRLKCPHVLVEEDLEGPSMDLGDIFGVVAEGSRSVWPVVQRIAVVDVNPHHDPKNMEFAETVGVNRSINVRVFRSVPQAENWMTGSASPPPGKP
jgi:hypothetical protein